MELLSNRLHPTALSDELLQDPESFRVPRLVPLGVVYDHTVIVFGGDSFVDIDSACAIAADILEAVELSGKDSQEAVYRCFEYSIDERRFPYARLRKGDHEMSMQQEQQKEGPYSTDDKDPKPVMR